MLVIFDTVCPVRHGGVVHLMAWYVGNACGYAPQLTSLADALLFTCGAAITVTDR